MFNSSELENLSVGTQIAGDLFFIELLVPFQDAKSQKGLSPAPNVFFKPS